MIFKYTSALEIKIMRVQSSQTLVVAEWAGSATSHSTRLARYAGCPTAHTPVIARLRDTRPKINNIAPNQHKNFTEVFNIFLTVFTIL
jgi:hypothetical protein